MKEEKAESQPSSIGAIGINGISDPGLKGIRLDIPKQETLEKTAVEWLKMQLEIRSGIKEITVDSKTFEELCEQAKEMEKQQIIEFANWLDKLTPAQRVSVWSKDGSASGLFTMDNEQLFEQFKKVTFKSE